MVSTGSDVQAGCSRVPASPEHASNVLVLAPAMEDAANEACADLLSCGNPAAEDMLLVTVVETPDERLDAWRRHSGGQLPAKVAVVGAGDGMRSAAAAGGSATMTLPGTQFQTTTVSEPGDLTGLGIKISQALSAWENDGNRITVCMHSLTGLLQYADLQRVFQFLHVLTKRIEAVGAVAHFHMDPTAHDTKTLATVRSLFDTVLEYEDGEWNRS